MFIITPRCPRDAYITCGQPMLQSLSKIKYHVAAGHIHERAAHCCNSGLCHPSKHDGALTAHCACVSADALARALADANRCLVLPCCLTYRYQSDLGSHISLSIRSWHFVLGSVSDFAGQSFGRLQQIEQDWREDYRMTIREPLHALCTLHALP